MTHRLADNGKLNVLTCKTALGLLLALIMACCGANVVLDSPSIPTPLVVKIPASVALRIPVEFESYIHEEEVIGREEWSINLGRSNAALFTQLFGFMFDKVTVIGPDDDATLLDIDALQQNLENLYYEVTNYFGITTVDIKMQLRDSKIFSKIKISSQKFV